MSLSKVKRSSNYEMLFSSFNVPWSFTDCEHGKFTVEPVSLTAIQHKICAKVLLLCTSVCFNRQSVFVKALCQIFDNKHFTVLEMERIVLTVLVFSLKPF